MFALNIIGELKFGMVLAWCLEFLIKGIEEGNKASKMVAGISVFILLGASAADLTHIHAHVLYRNRACTACGLFSK